MELIARVYEGDSGWRYEILQDGTAVIRQDCLPGAEGFVPMDQSTAERLSAEIIQRLEVAHASDQQ